MGRSSPTTRCARRPGACATQSRPRRNDPPGLFGRRTRRLAKRAHRIQAILGDHRDAVLLAEQIGRARALAQHRGEDAAPYDAMSRASKATAERKLAALGDATRKLKAAVRALKK